MNKKLSKNTYTIIAGGIFFLLFVFSLVNRDVFLAVPVLILSIMLLARCNPWATSIPLLLIGLLKIFLLIKESTFVFMYFDSTDIFRIAMNLLAVISTVFLALLALMSETKASGLTKRLWFIPAVLELLKLVLGQIAFATIYAGLRENYPISYILVSHRLSIIQQILYCVGFAFVGLFFRRVDIIKDTCNPTTSSYDQSNNDGYCGMAKHILLLLFVGWIWQYVWIYRTTEYLNKTPNEEKRNPTTTMLLCMFIPFYYLYWIYQSAQRIDILAKEKNIQSDIAILSVVLALFIGIVPPILMQSKINQICTYRENSTPAPAVDAIQQNIAPTSDKTEEIRNYKKLLDDGIITEEEFAEKKKQLMGLKAKNSVMK